MLFSVCWQNIPPSFTFTHPFLAETLKTIDPATISLHFMSLTHLLQKRTTHRQQWFRVRMIGQRYPLLGTGVTYGLVPSGAAG